MTGTLWKNKCNDHVGTSPQGNKVLFNSIATKEIKYQHYLWKPATTYIVSSKTQAADPLHFVGTSPVVRCRNTVIIKTRERNKMRKLFHG